MAIASDMRTVVGVFNSVQEAQNAVRELEGAGVPRSEISIVANKNAAGYDTMSTVDRDKASDVVADAGIGAAIGGVGGLLLSAAGALTIPVIGPVLAAGPIAAALTGAGIGAAAGGLVGALTETGIPEEQARYYAEGVRRGDVLVTVKSEPARTDQVCDILDRNNAVDVDERVSNWQQRGWSGWREDAKPFTDAEYRKERTYYTGPTLTGQSGIGVDKERSRMAGNRDTGVVGTTGMTGAGLTSRTADTRTTTEKAGDKMREWKEDVKDTFRDNEQRTGTWNTDVRDTGYDSRTEHSAERNVGAWADETRGDFGTVDARSGGGAMDEMKRDAKEAWRDTKDVLHGRTGPQPHDVREDAREAERRRRARVYDRTMI